jgi:predicted metal-dependent hydrolase
MKIFRSNKKRYLKHKEDARTLVTERLEYFSTVHDFEYNRVSIRNQKTRWGSCSTKGNLNFNYKIFFLPPHMRDYIIVHELCHLKEFNHSRNFWDLVEEICPDCFEIRKELRKQRLFFR